MITAHGSSHSSMSWWPRDSTWQYCATHTHWTGTRFIDRSHARYPRYMYTRGVFGKFLLSFFSFFILVILTHIRRLSLVLFLPSLQICHPCGCLRKHLVLPPLLLMLWRPSMAASPEQPSAAPSTAASAAAVIDLQSQLQDTPSSLASHLDKMCSGRCLGRTGGYETRSEDYVK